ncbi:hypothetical protein AHF37_07411 [Paragonimus kellicotti]|nr:hypothetical protein AHF37_07411 [Paragonimus kellicotti]
MYKLESVLLPTAIDTATLGSNSRTVNRTDFSKSVPTSSDLQIQVIDCLDCYTQHNGPILLMFMHQNVDMKRVRDQGSRTESRLVCIDDRMKLYQLVNRFNKLTIQIQVRETEELGKSDSPVGGGRQQTKTKAAAPRKLEKMKTTGSQSGLNTQVELEANLANFTALRSLFSRNHFGGLLRKGPVQDYFLQLFHMHLILEEVLVVRV